MRICTNCGETMGGKLSQVTHTMCPNCGSGVLREVDPKEVYPHLKFVNKYCNGCGKSAPDGKRMCNNCGGIL